MSRILYGNQIVTDGLVLHLDAANPWSYDGNSVYWRDLSGNNNGTLINGLTYNNLNKGIIFNGVNDYIQLSNSFTFEINYSISIWIDLTNASTTQYFLGGPNMGVRYNGTSFLVFNGESGWSELNWTKINDVINLTIIRDTLNNFDFYINTVYIGKTIMGGTLSPIINYIGMRHDGFYFNGNISNIQFYNKRLSQSQILQNYNSTKLRFI